MILYHGSTLEILHPDITFSREKLDFGRGFYTTPIKQQAINWAMRFKRLGKSAVLNYYEFDESLFSQFHTKEFYSYNEQWLDFILANRTGKEIELFDIVIGGVANDRVFNTIELLMENLISKQDALGRLIYEENNQQICFLKQEVLNQHLIFKGSEIL
ncbi:MULTISPECIES: DUF3990 domain-containing protein [Glaesserella]|uniref:Sortase n=1 Tax=Glaesserella australis TaxID=2094024 RepID=A0A328BZ09_9PAST|nr:MULTISPECIES: DUF3990 domain-containing protein [Glaesserella]AUI66323.1 sortase [Glaesserella sp. 15-184]RAL19463.1 sortase [Glaesserella australis]